MSRADRSAHPTAHAAAGLRDRRAFLRATALTAGGLLVAALVGCGDEGERRPVPLRTRDRPSRDPAGVLRLGLPGAAADPPPPGLVAATLCSVDPRSGRIYTDLAREMEWRPDGLQLAVRLSDDGHFHTDADGQRTRVSAHAVRLDFERRAADGEFFAREVIESIDTPADDTVVLTLAAPFSVLFEVLGDPDQASIWRLDADGRPVLGSGPFAPDPTPDAAGVLRLARHPDYHAPRRPRLEAVELVRPMEGLRPDDWAARGLHAWVLPDGGEHPTIPAGAALQSRASRTVRGLGLSLIPQKGGAEVRHLEAMQDPRVRLAVAQALDREALLAVDGSTTAGPVGPAHPLDALSAEELARSPVYTHDPAEARLLLEAAGATGLPIRLEVPNRPLMRTLGRAVEAQLREAGFAPQLQLLSEGAFGTVLAQGNFEAVLFEAPPVATPDFSLRLHGSAGVGGGFSPWGYSNPVYDAAVDRALRAVLPTERAEHARAAQRLLLEDVPAMFPIGAPQEHALVDETVENFAFDAYAHNESWYAAAWRVPTGEA